MYGFKKMQVGLTEFLSIYEGATLQRALKSSSYSTFRSGGRGPKKIVKENLIDFLQYIVTDKAMMSSSQCLASIELQRGQLLCSTL